MNVLTSVAHAFSQVQVKPSAYTDKGAIIGSNIFNNLRTKVGVIHVPDTINLKPKTFHELKAQGMLPPGMLVN